MLVMMKIGMILNTRTFYYRYNNGKYTRKKEGYLFYEPIDRNKYLSAKVMSSL